MPTFKRFNIRNFKGIESTSISLDERTNNSVITLIGLNESGKTTILEALSHFLSNDKLVSSLFKGNSAKSDILDLIPINKRSAFSDEIEIEGIAELDDEDISSILALADRMGCQVDPDRLSNPFKAINRLTFKDSTLIANNDYWDIEICTRADSESEFIRGKPDYEHGEFWLASIALIKKNLPAIAYFPTFLVDIPNRIYLQEHDNETAANRHYRSIFQSIMEGIDDGLDLGTHVSNRINLYASGKNKVTWLAQFMTSPEKNVINSVFQKVSNSVTKEVIGGWRRVFSKDSTAKQISVEWNIDTNKDNLPYASFMVSDGESKYEISERSLGFRWFFSFLLFTGFKGQSNKQTLLIFDEPAANLHAKAQAELLKSFEKIATNGTKIIYSTHSHHMINPKWLSGAYIVENTALNLEAEEDFGFSSYPTNIKATKYREFISKYPTRSSYFQPVIESLDYVTPELIGSPPFVLVEGISDYYALTIAHKLSKLRLNFRILPGVGSGASGPLISLMMGRGEKFVVLLDDDPAGLKECTRYKESWFLPESVVFTLASINKEFTGFALEDLIDEETYDLIKKRLEISSKPSKKQIGWYFAESSSTADDNNDILSESLLKKLVKILTYLNKNIELSS